ncbi:hypothetical protein, partial [Streptococcus pneumoniae]|uniref:hypothetical protein n=1 Tax=Streptococcus pneumoniae TaxID=1313 RepID=UPI00398ED826
YRSGNVFLYRIDGKLKPSDVAGIMNKYSDVSVAAAGGSINLPLKYIILNPADIILSNSSSIGTGSFYKVLSDFEVAILS